MSVCDRLQRRGAALLIVLAALVLVLAVAAPAAQLSGLVARERRDAAAWHLLDDLLPECGRPIRHWLHEHSDRVALSPDTEAPAAHVLADRVRVPGIGDVHLRITAYDQCGMVPWGTTDRALSGILPDDLRSLAPVAAPGLDLFADGSRPAFPDPTGADSVVASGQLIATHNPPTRNGGPRPAINVNTAPRRLLEAALRSTGRGAVEAILQARSEGRPFSAFARAGVQEDAAGPRIVGASDCWAFRIDLRAASVARSWWLVYRLRGSEWVRVQLLAAQ